MPHAQRAAQHTSKIYSGFSVYSIILCLPLTVFFCFSSIQPSKNRNFVTAHRPKEKVSNNLDAKCMMKRSEKKDRGRMREKKREAFDAKGS